MSVATPLYEVWTVQRFDLFNTRVWTSVKVRVCRTVQIWVPMSIWAFHCVIGNDCYSHCSYQLGLFDPQNKKLHLFLPWLVLPIYQWVANRRLDMFWTTPVKTFALNNFLNIWKFSITQSIMGKTYYTYLLGFCVYQVEMRYSSKVLFGAMATLLDWSI